MKKKTRSEDDRLIGRFYRTELFANAVGAPLAAAYGAFMIDFSGLSPTKFLLGLGVVMAANQLFLAMPLNLFLGSRIRARLASLRKGDAPDTEGQYRFFNRLPFLQAGLVFARILVSATAVLLTIYSAFQSTAHFAAVLSFGLYAGFFAGIVIYYYLRNTVASTLQGLVAGFAADHPIVTETRNNRLAAIFAGLPLVIPTVITSAGIGFLVIALRLTPGMAEFFTFRIMAALAMNILTMVPLTIVTRWFHARRLGIIQAALGDMVDRGDTTRAVPSDLNDDYAVTAHQINRAFDLFRLVLSKMESASGELSGTVMSFSSQIAETVAATTQQAAAVKQMVGTMDGSNQIGERIQQQARALGDNARESSAYVDEGFGKVQDTIHKMDEIKDANLQTMHEIGELSDEISSIGEIIEIINGIANQTRIIAFNAELEASSAGAAGTSFRIVAEEIRRLANGTVDSLVGIKNRIGQIQHGSERLLGASEEGTAKIEEGLRLSGDLNGIFMHIRQSADSTAGSAEDIGGILSEQNQAFDQIFLTLKQISEGAEQVLASTKISGTEVGRLQTLIGGLKQTLARFGYGTSDAARIPTLEVAP